MKSSNLSKAHRLLSPILFYSFLIMVNLAYCQEKKDLQLPWIKGSTTLAVMPDTQYYAQKYPHYFEAQTKWIAENYIKRNIVYVLHLGDITEHDVPREWKVATHCFSMIDGKVPYLLVPGNHDYSGGGRNTQLSRFFPVEKMRKWPTFGGVYEKDKLDNNYHLFKIGDQDWIALGLECGPRNNVIAWANKVLRKYSNRRAIVVTHAYLFRNNQRYDYHKGKERASPHGFLGEGADGQELWERLICRHPNMMIVISGHVATGGLGYLASEGDYGNTVHQMMVCYQKMRGGGQAYMRVLEFLPNGKTVKVRTFSPALKLTRTSKLEDFSFELKGPTRTKPKQTSISSGTSAKLSKAPIHRYSFNIKDEDKTKIVDSTGDAPGVLQVVDSNSTLDGKGQLSLNNNGWVKLPSHMLKNLEDISFEIWFTPLANHYRWTSVVRFGNRRDWLTYVFRTLTVHRAEIAVNKYNNDIQIKKVPVKPGKQLYIVVTYDHDGANGKPLLSYFRNGKLIRTMQTNILLSNVDDAQDQIGPFTGKFNELRIYNYPLSPAEVKGSFDAGPDSLVTR